MGQELVAHPVQARQIQSAEVVVQQLPKATALLQPLVGGQLAARLHHAARRILLGHRLPRHIQAIDDRIQLSAQQRLDALGQRCPLGAGHLEVAPEIEQRVLA
jgi:hypothetical protein